MYNHLSLNLRDLLTKLILDFFNVLNYYKYIMTL